MAKNGFITEYHPLSDERIEEILRKDGDPEKISLCLEVAMLRKIVYGTARTLDTRFIRGISNMMKEMVDNKEELFKG